MPLNKFPTISSDRFVVFSRRGALRFPATRHEKGPVMQFPQTLDEPVSADSIVPIAHELSTRKIAARDVPRPGERRTVVVPVLLALAVLAMVGAADYLTGHEILFSIFYLVPVAIAA